MFKIKTLITGLIFTFASSLAAAHSDHGDVAPITEKEAGSASVTVLKSLVKTKEVNEKWLAEKPQKTSLKKIKDDKVWETVFINKNEEDVSKQNLYIYFDEMGSFLGAGHEPMKE